MGKRREETTGKLYMPSVFVTELFSLSLHNMRSRKAREEIVTSKLMIAA
jgi:hypothetical protein